MVTDQPTTRFLELLWEAKKYSNVKLAIEQINKHNKGMELAFFFTFYVLSGGLQMTILVFATVHKTWI